MRLPEQRAIVLTRLVAGKVTVEAAALLLRLAPRSVRRPWARFVDAGPKALIHGNSGRRPAHLPSGLGLFRPCGWGFVPCPRLTICEPAEKTENARR